MAEVDAHPNLGHPLRLQRLDVMERQPNEGGNINERLNMTKSQKKLERFHLTEEEKKAIRKADRYEALISSLELLLALVIGVTALWIACGAFAW